MLKEYEGDLLRLQYRYEAALDIITASAACRKIIRLMISEGGAWSRKGIADALWMPSSTVKDRLKVLKDIAAIKRTRSGWRIVREAGELYLRSHREAIVIAFGHQVGFSAQLLADLDQYYPGAGFGNNTAAQEVCFSLDLPEELGILTRGGIRPPDC